MHRAYYHGSTHRLIESAMCSLTLRSHPVVVGNSCGTPLRSRQRSERIQWRASKTDNEDIIQTLIYYYYYYYAHGKITQRGIRRFCVANGPCKLRTGFHGIVRVVIIIFLWYCYSRTRTFIGGYVLNQQQIYSSPADDVATLRWNMRDIFIT